MEGKTVEESIQELLTNLNTEIDPGNNHSSQS